MIRIFTIILFSLLFLFLTGDTFAASNKFITIVNPIRGDDFFQLQDAKPQDNFKKQWEEISKRGLFATWLLRPDALKNNQVVNIAKSLNGNQELGLFLEITPKWAEISGVEYRKNQNWHSAGSVFLTGYEVEERYRLIDGAFEEFKEIFGGYPKSVGAWWIDANSLKYMEGKYGIQANLDVADQYSTDNYQVWGQYFSTPFYPSKMNALIPASSLDQKINIVTLQWATRDPFNSFGNGVLDSTYSVQANDYANKKFHNLNTEYFKKLLSIYLDNPYSEFGQVTIGLENDFKWDEFGEEYKRQLDVVLEQQKKGVRVNTMSEFAINYAHLFPKTSPPQIIFAKDPLESKGYVLWYQNIKYRVGWFYGNSGSVIKDLRLFFDSHEEPCLYKRCDELNLATAQTGSIDEVTYKNGWIIDEGRITDPKISFKENTLELTYINQSGIKRNIIFLENDINLDGQLLPIQVWISKALNQPKNFKKEEGNFDYKLLNPEAQILSQTKNFFIFVVFVVCAFYLPGSAALKKADIDINDKFILTIPVGIAIFALLTFILGFINFTWGILILPIISILILRKSWIIPKFTMTKNFILGFFIVLAGSITWLATSVKNGLIYDFGVGFWGPHGHDGIWHIGLIESIKKGFPVENPAFAGEKLVNYHYFYDLVLAQTSNITNINPVDLYFRMFPILLAFSIGAVSYILAKQWFKSEIGATMSVFFLYFGGSFGWILSFLRDKSFGGETYFWAQQGISTLINPPFATSILIFLAGLYLFLVVTQQKNQLKLLVIPLIVLWGTLIEFKAYAGILVLGSLSIISLVWIIKQKFTYLLISIPIGLLSLFVFLPNNNSSGSLLVFSPFWIIHSMIDSPDRVGWFRLQLARMAGQETGDWFKFLVSEIAGLFIFISGNLGTRIIGVLGLKKIFPNNIYNFFILLFLVFSFIIPLIFIQKGANFNIVQFFYYFIFIFNFLAGIACLLLIKKLKWIGTMVVVLLVLLTFPTTWSSLQNYLPERPPSRISTAELEALKFLKTKPEGIVLSFYDKNLRERFSEPTPLFTYESTMYVSAFTGKSEFIADTVNLIILDVDYKGRLQTQKDILEFRENNFTKRLLEENKIKYVYLPKISGVSSDESFGLKKIFENEEVLIYEKI